MSVSNLRFDGDNVLIDVDASPSGDGAHADPKDLRFGLYGALAHPLEAPALGGCRDVTDLGVQPLSAPTPGEAHGHGVSRAACATSPRCAAFTSIRRSDRMRGHHDVLCRCVSRRAAADQRERHRAFAQDHQRGRVPRGRRHARPDRARRPRTRSPASGYMLLGLEIAGLAARYRDESKRARRSDDGGGGADAACARAVATHATSTVRRCWCCPTRRWTRSSVRASLCTQGDINAALLYPTVSVIGTHAGLWTTENDVASARARPNGARATGVGPWQGPFPTTPATTPHCCATVIPATSLTHTGTGRAKRSSPTSTSAGTRCTSRSRTSATTPTSVRWCAPPTRSRSTPCTSSAVAGGTGAAPW